LTRFILVRHGETDWNKVHRIQGGASDTPLNELGRQQAEDLALRLKSEKIEAIYSSPLRRALDTAQAIARCHQLKITPLASLKEINVGAMEGFPSAELRLRFDEYICRDHHIQSPFGTPDSEYISDVQKRSWDTVKSLAGRHEGAVAVVTHYFVIVSLVCRVLNLPLTEIGHLKLSPGTVTSFTLEGDAYARLELFNDGCRTAII
jgi:broad specificity phosphatase PhoE